MPETAFNIDRHDPKTVSMEKVAEALILAATEVVNGYLTPDVVARLAADNEDLAIFIQRNAIHVSASAIGNVAGHGGATMETIMEALGTAIGDGIAAQGESALIAGSVFMNSLSEKLEDHGIGLMTTSDDLPGEIVSDNDDDKGPLQ